MSKDKFKYINNFPFIIMVGVAIVLIILLNIYLNVKPDKVISFNGYMVLQGDTTYNLMNKFNVEESMDANAVQVYNGDYVYKQLDSYFVGTKEKKEIDFSYPAYSNDGITLYTINGDFNLIRNDFQSLEGYPGLSVSYGMLYNIGDEEPIDDQNYFFLDLKNSIYINTTSMSIKTLNNEYEITVNSPIYFNTKYINYYTFDGISFKYNRIDDIYYDSIIKIGKYTLTYEEFLLKMGIVKLKTENEQQEIIENEEIDEEIKKEENEENINSLYQKPTISFDNFKIGVYYINSNITIIDSSNVVISNPTFELYDETGKLVLRKKITTMGDFNIKGLLPETKYHVIGSFTYKNEIGLEVENIFYDDYITTNSIDSLDPIDLQSEVGDKHPNKIEIKNLKILNLDNEALYGVNRVTIKLDDAEYNISYSQINSLKSGDLVTVLTPNKLNSNTLYNYEIKFYDKSNNELMMTGMYKGQVQTSKKEPTISIESNIENENLSINLKTNNKDNIYIYDYKYELYSYSGYFVGEGILNYEDSINNEIYFSNLDYNTNYILKVSGIYDLEDGKGNQNLNYEFDFSIENINNLVSFYDESSTVVTTNTITTDVYIKKFSALEREDTKIYIYLADKDGNEILDDSGKIKYLNEYLITDLEEENNSYKNITTSFENLNSQTEYQLKLKVVINQLEQDLEFEKIFEPNIKTLASDAYVEVINSKLLGNTLDLYFNIKDIDNKITENKIIIEIYEGKYENLDEIVGKKYIHRQLIELEEIENNYVNITLDDYSLNDYTAFISSNPYDDKKIKTYLEILNGNNDFVEDKNYSLNVSREVKASLEIFEQQVSSENPEKMITDINLAYYLSNSKINFILLDCVNDSCKKIGSIYNDGSINSIDGVSIEDSTNNMLKERGNKIDKRIKIENNKNESHKFYLTVKKSIEEIERIDLNDYYVLNEIEFDTSKPIYNIDEVNDFYKVSGKSDNYVVTANLDFEDNQKTINFNGYIDFQGYTLNLYENANSKSNLFSNLGNSTNKTATIKNFVINYEIGFDGVKKAWYGFVNNNYGNIENFIININQTNEDARSTALGLISRYNYGEITKFSIYLKSNIHIYSLSGLLTYKTYSSGIISNGYIAPLSLNNKIYTHDNSSKYGTYAYENNGTIKNVYNLVDIISNDNAPVAAFVYSNTTSTAVLNNTLSVAHTTKVSSNENGPNVYSNNAHSKAYNNFYFDGDNLSFNNKYNQQINKSILRNLGVFEVILNSDLEKGFTVLSGYYPIVKMSNFMMEKQNLIPISFDYTESDINIVSTELINQNKEEGLSTIGIYISNPNKLEIMSIDVDGINSEEIINKSYDETKQFSYITLKIKLESEDTVKSNYESYEINSFKYNTEMGTEYEKEYITNKPRIEIVMYRPVKNYSELVNAINANENIFLVNDIDYGNSSKVPNNMTYTAILDGNNKTLNLKKFNLSKGYFIQKIEKGTIKNIQISNMNIDINNSNQYIGFVGIINNSLIENIDMLDSEIKIGTLNTITRYVGNLIGKMESSTINKVSINNSIIDVKQNGTTHESFIGGIAGYDKNSEINNSYVYNIKIDSNYLNFIRKTPIGGISGYSETSRILNSYTYGNIKSNSSYVGGIIGFSKQSSNSSSVENCYSFVNISSLGNYLGGIVGVSGATTKIINNMFVGNISNINNNANISTIVPNSNEFNSNYDLGGTSFQTTSNYEEFDINDTFSKEGSKLLPYLKDTSFVEQKIKEIIIETNNIDSYAIEYLDNYNNVITNKEDYPKATSAYIYINNELKEGDNNLLKIENIDNDSIEYQYKYLLTPNEIYTSIYDVELSDGSKKTLSLEFYKSISNSEDWKNISNSNAENIILLDDLILTDNTDNFTNKKLNNVVCGKGSGRCKISGQSTENKLQLEQSLIYILSGTISNVEFSNIIINKSSSDYIGVISYNTGKIHDCNFNNIEVTAKNYIGIIGFSDGVIINSSIENIEIIGTNYVGGLIGFDYNHNSKIDSITAKSITVSGEQYVGGIAGRINPISGGTNQLINSKVENSTIKGRSYVGGMLGHSSSTLKGNKVLNSTIEGNGINGNIQYIGGVAGYINTGESLSSQDINIILTNNNNRETTYVGGVVGFSGNVIKSSSAEDIIIGNKRENDIIEKINATYVGGIAGSSYGVNTSYVRNSQIYANENVGGIVGQITAITWNTTFDFSKNTVSLTDVFASENTAGGLIGYCYSERITINVKDNTIISKEGNNFVKANSNVGGVIGYLKNDIDFMQNFQFENNFVENYIVSTTNNENSKTAGGLIGRLYKVPNSENKYIKNSLFYGSIITNDQYGVGKIDNFSTSPSYGNLISEYEFSKESGFKQYVLNIEYVDTQINQQDKISYNATSFEKTDGYFPILKNYNYKEEDKVEIPSSTQYSAPRMLAFARRPMSVQSAPIDLDYEVYASDVNKLNIEFSNIDETVNFFYEIGNYTSDLIPINKRTYTITYDFKTPIKIYLVNSSTSQNKTYDSKDLSKNISIVNNSTYYIKNNILYSEEDVIKGNFVNLYGNKALSINGTIYNISSKTSYTEPINYNVLSNSIPLYKFTYNGTNIETYYNYSVINGEIKNYQAFVIQNKLSIVDNSLNNKKDAYVIDFYNNKEIQLILNNDNKLYNLKDNINYPSDMLNENIKDIFSNINSDSKLIVIEYDNGEIYTFNYVTGKRIFSNKYNSDMNLFEYLSDKLNSSSSSNKINNISNSSEYENVEKMKEKLILNSVEDAKNIIYETNSLINKNKNYIVVYNPINKKYNIYETNELLSNDVDTISENDKIYKDYELVQFYNNSKKNNEKKSLSGIIIFTLTIISILTALYLLINKKRMRRAI